jgi:hypothetical protein
MLSGLLEPPEPEAASGGFIIGVLFFGGAAFGVCASATVPALIVVTAVSAMRIVSVVHVIHLLRFISSSIAMTAGCGLYVRSMVCAAIDPVRKQDSCVGRGVRFRYFRFGCARHFRSTGRGKAR